MMRKLLEMDEDIRTWMFIGYFLVSEFFILFFFSHWLLVIPFILLFLLFYTNHKAEKLKQQNKQNNSV